MKLIKEYTNPLWIFRYIALSIWFAIILRFTGIDGVINNLVLSVTMVFGSFLAGATPVGGGAVAYPVLTLVLKAPPEVASAYSLAIQSFGMTAASIAIFVKKIRINWPLLLISIPCGMLGYVISFFWISVFLSPAMLKIFFASFWLAFGYILSRTTSESARPFSAHAVTTTASPIGKYLIFSGFSFVGGLVTSWVGNGMDVIFFAMAIILFSERESVATPTSVIIMASLSLFGTAINLATGHITETVVQYLSAAIPVVIFLAPLGAIFISAKSDEYIRRLLLALVFIQYLVTMFLTCNSIQLAVFSAVIIAGSIVFTFIIRRAGHAAEHQGI